jgi:hypothetical protein
VIVATRANDGEYPSVNHLLFFLVGQTVDVRPRSEGMVRQLYNRLLANNLRTLRELHGDTRVSGFDDLANLRWGVAAY